MSLSGSYWATIGLMDTSGIDLDGPTFPFGPECVQSVMANPNEH